MKEIVNILSDSYFTMCSCFYLNQVFVVVPQREKNLVSPELLASPITALLAMSKSDMKELFIFSQEDTL